MMKRDATRIECGKGKGVRGIDSLKVEFTPNRENRSKRAKCNKSLKVEQ